MNLKKVTLMSATALVSVGSIAHAGNLDAAPIEADPVAALSQLATFSGATGTSAYTFTPTWSDELGCSATGALGYQTSGSTALGLFITAGQRQREALLNFGLAIDAERQIIFSGGQLQEKLGFGTAGEQEWIGQNQFGVAYDARNYALSLYHVDSESTDNFVGAKSTGAEMDGTVGLSDVATLNYAAGYQTLSWDDDADDENGLTARLGLDYQATPDMRVNVFADHNVSENQFGIGAQWQLGTGTLSANYTRIEGNVGTISDDNRLALMLSMPLGGSNSSGAAVTRAATGGNSGAVVTSSSSLLADVMRRPDYLPQRVIVREATSSSVCALTGGIADIDETTVIGYEFGDVASDPGSTVGIASNTVSWNDPQTVPSGDYAVYLVTTGDLVNSEVLSLGMHSIAGTSFSVNAAGQQFLDDYWGGERLTAVIFLQDDGDCVITSDDTSSILLNFDFLGAP